MFIEADKVACTFRKWLSQSSRNGCKGIHAIAPITWHRLLAQQLIRAPPSKSTADHVQTLTKAQNILL